MSAKILFEDDVFKIVRSNDYVLIRKHSEYDFHSHFKRFSGAIGLIKLFYNKLQPSSQYFSIAMKRITTEEEYNSFLFKKPKQMYFNINKGFKSRVH